MLKNSGFTLLEILIALFIFTIVSMITVSVLHVVLNGQDRTDKQTTRFTELQTTLFIFSRDIEQTINRSITNAKGESEAALTGTSDTLYFTHAGFMNPNAQMTRSTLQRAGYVLNKNSLIRQSWDVLDQAAKSMPSDRILLHDVLDLRFEYLDEKKRFHDDWPPKESKNTGLPYAVRITLTLKNSETLSQLLLIPVRIKTSEVMTAV